MTYPRDTAGRQAERDRLAAKAEQRAQAAAEHARAEANAVGMSIKCGGASRWTPDGERIPWHAHEAGGCANDGGSCICACHDQPTPAVDPAGTTETEGPR